MQTLFACLHLIFINLNLSNKENLNKLILYIKNNRNKIKKVLSMPPIDYIVESFKNNHCNINIPKIYTIGYEGKTIDEFIKLLKYYNINSVVDVRELPLSRKKGFSKKSLSENLSKNNIEYIHMKNLGTPKKLRDMLKSNSISFEEYAKQYREYINTNGIDSLKKLLHYGTIKSCVLLCYELNWKRCHRSIISDYLSSAGFEVIHI